MSPDEPKASTVPLRVVDSAPRPASDNVLPLRPHDPLTFSPRVTFPREKSNEIAALERRLKMAPTHAATRERLLALLLERIDHLDPRTTENIKKRRIADCFRAVELDPESAPAWAARAREQVEKDHALADITRAIELNPDNGDYYSYRGLLHSLHRREFLAAIDYGAAFERTGELYHLRARIDQWGALKRLDLARADLDLALARFGDDEPDVFLIRARFRWNYDGGTAGAIAELDAGLERHPDSAELLHERGLRRSQHGDREGAELDHTRAVALCPTHSWYLYERATNRRKLGDLEGALADWTRCLKLDRRDTWALAHRAALLIDCGRPRAALRDINRAIRREPEEADHYALRALCE